MPTKNKRKLKVFLCHASEDKPAVRELYKRLKSEKWIEPWLDEESLLPGQDWDVEIYKATRDADAIIIALSEKSVQKEGYVNKEIRRVLDIAQEKPPGTIYIIPLRLDDCKPSFRELQRVQWVDYFPDEKRSLAYGLLLRSFFSRFKLEIDGSKDNNNPSVISDDRKLYVRREAALFPKDEIIQIEPVQLRKLIFSSYDLPEFELFCNDLGVNYDNLRGVTYETKILSLIRWHERRGVYTVLVRKFLEDNNTFHEK